MINRTKPELVLEKLLSCTIFFACLLHFLPAPLQAGPSPQRIISLGPINTENVFLLGAGDRLLANTSYCLRPEGAKAKEKIGSVMHFSTEKILSLKPDLILATGLTRPDQVQQFKQAGIRVIHVHQPKTFAEICDRFLKLGMLLGLEHRAHKIIAHVQKQVAAVQKRVAELPAQKVLLQVGAQPLFVSTPSSFTNDFITLSGGVNIGVQQQTGRASYEEIIANNPDVIIVAITGTESGIAAKEKAKWQSMPVLNAARNNRIFVIDPDISCSPSPKTFANTLEIISYMIHPETTSTQSP